MCHWHVPDQSLWYVTSQLQPRDSSSTRSIITDTVLRRSRVLVRSAQDLLHHIPHHPRLGNRSRWRAWCREDRFSLLEDTRPLCRIHRHWRLGQVSRILGLYELCSLLFRRHRIGSDGSGRDEKSSPSHTESMQASLLPCCHLLLARSPGGRHARGE